MALRRTGEEIENKTYSFRIRGNDVAQNAIIYFNGNPTNISISSNSKLSIDTDSLINGRIITIAPQKDGVNFDRFYEVILGDLVQNPENGTSFYEIEVYQGAYDGERILIDDNGADYELIFNGTQIVDEEDETTQNEECYRYQITSTQDDPLRYIETTYTYTSTNGSTVEETMNYPNQVDIIRAKNGTVEVILGAANVKDLGPCSEEEDDTTTPPPPPPFTPPPLTEGNLRVILNGPSNSVILSKENGGTFQNGIGGGVEDSNRIELPTGEISFKDTIGRIFSIFSKDVNLFSITQIRVDDGIKTQTFEADELAESLSTEIIVDRELITVFLTVERVPNRPIPTITLLDEVIDKELEFDSSTGISTRVALTGNVEKVTAYVNGQSIEYVLIDGQETITIPQSAFNQYIGVYTVTLVPSNQSGDGFSVEFNVNVVDETELQTPDIINITYPELVNGADYKGTDVEFQISWESVNTQYIRLYKDRTDIFIDLPPEGTTTLNFKDWLGIGGVEDIEDSTGINLTLLMIPYNNTGFEVVEGKTEVLPIKLDTGDLTIPRSLAINRIVGRFIEQFDTSSFEIESSKYLTHLLNFGDGDSRLIANWTGSENSLIIKLYEPIEVGIQPNEEVWILKPQSSPIVETISITDVEESFCTPIKGPNFTIEPDNGIGYRYFDELIASGSYTSNNLVVKYLKTNGIDTDRLNIQYVSNSNYSFQNFSFYGSAEERIRNFYYKLGLINKYKTNYDDLITLSSGEETLLTTKGYQKKTNNDIFDINWNISDYRNPTEGTQAKKILDNLNNLFAGLDGFEKWLYTSTNALAYPKIEDSVNGEVFYELYSIDSPQSLNWFNSAIESASEYDRFNSNYLVNNIPEFIKEDYQNEDFIIFLDMLGQHFDTIWVYINSLNRLKKVDERKEFGIQNDLIWYLLNSFGWKGKRAYDSQFLWEYVFGVNKEGNQKYRIPLEQANNEVWRRILNNLPYLLKHKGTKRAMKAVMACYGVPQSLLTIMEFGGPEDPTEGGSQKFTFDDRTAALALESTSYVSVPWKESGSPSDYPQSIEFRIKPDEVVNSRLITSQQFSLDIIKTTGSFVNLQFNIGDENIYISSASSTSFPLSTEEYSNILLNKYDTGLSSSYEIRLKTSNGERITTDISMSFTSESVCWETGSELKVGEGLVGNLDEFRLWRVPLQPSKFENHTLFPDAINGNSYTASTADLLFRLDFERPKDRVSDPYIKNVAINQTYGEPFATASNMYSATDYPYQYTPYERTVTATVPSLGYNLSNKIRFEEQTLITDLSYKARATEKSFDRAPIDSNRLGLFFSPIKELNMDILKSFGNFNIDNYIGDPEDYYRDEYKQLGELRTYYFERLNRNINEYIQLVRYIDKSLFDSLSELAPARARVSKGLLIEPHYLERSKTKWDKPISERNDYETLINVNDSNTIELTYDVQEGNLDVSRVSELSVDYDNITAIINEEDEITLVGEPNFYDGDILYSTEDLLTGDYPVYDVSIEVPFEATIIGQAEALQSEQIGFQKNSLSNLGLGLYATNGTGSYREIDIFGNLIENIKSIYLVTEEYTEKINTQTGGWPTNGASPGDVVVYEDVAVTKERYRIDLLSVGTTPSVVGNVSEVERLNGYFNTHYRYVNGLSSGLEKSFFKGSVQNDTTTPDGLPAVETFNTNPNIIRVADSGRGSGEPILIVE